MQTPRSVPEALEMAADVLGGIPTGARNAREQVLFDEFIGRVRFRIASLIPGDRVDLRDEDGPWP